MPATRSASFVRAMIVTMRPYLMFLSGITGLAGLAAAPDAAPPIIAAVFVASFLSYGFGQALTDCFQTDTDAISAPYRPLVRGTVRRNAVLGTSLAGLVLCSLLFTLGNPLNLALGAIAVGGLATYTWFKRRWWGGPWYNAWIVVVLFLMGFLAGTGPVREPAVPLPLILLVFSGYANFVIAGYFKDVEADRQTGYRTFPVVFGRTRAAVVSDLFALGAVTGLVLHFAALPEDAFADLTVIPAAVFGLWGVGLVIRAQTLLHRNREDRHAHAPIRMVVGSYILLLSAAIAALHPLWSLPLLAFYVAFEFVLRHRTEESQI